MADVSPLVGLRFALVFSSHGLRHGLQIFRRFAAAMNCLRNHFMVFGII
jgi:hypothetical protein